MDTVLAGLQSALEGRYRIERELGRGGMATVYLARDLKHNRSVALKVLQPDLAAALGPERFLREVQLTASLQHPHILSVYDSGEAAGRLWYTMPFVEGETLSARLGRERQLPLDDALQIARNILAALAYAHSHGVIHRDIKPENILLESGEAVLADFGIARAISAAGGEHLTQTGMTVGTPAYMSPEQAAGGTELDGRSDLYSVGCVLYEMLAGEPPYTGPTAQAILAKRFLEPVPHLRTLRETVPEPVEGAVTKALAKVPADRWASAGEFAHALTAATSGSAPATLPTAVGVPQLPAHRRRLRGARAALVGLGVLAGLAVAVLIARGVHGHHPSAAGPKMLAVLPFENLGRAEDEYFADGLTEEITSRLASVSGLGVISRTSANQYKKTTKSLKQVGRELGAGYLLEGSVRWEKPTGGPSRIRVTPQLIQVADDRHLWADRYDAELADVFQVQGTIAQEVTAALDVALRPPERQALTNKPTSNLDAYTRYLRAEQLFDQSDVTAPKMRAIAELYERALALDSNFARAAAHLSILDATMYWLYVDRTDARLAQAKAAAELALRREPNLAEAHEAMGYYYYYGLQAYDHALEELGTALRAQPSNSEVLEAIGRVQRRKGQLKEALATLRRAAELDPRSVSIGEDLAHTLTVLRSYPEAINTWDRVLTLAPDLAEGYAAKAEALLLWRGDTLGAREVVRQGIDRVGLARTVYPVFGTSNGFEFLLLLSDVAPRDVAHLSLAGFQADTNTYLTFKAQWHFAHRRSSLGRVYADSARRYLELKVHERPQDNYWHQALGAAYAMLGRKADAVREDRRGIELMPADNVWGRVFALTASAYTRALASQPDTAMDLLEHLLATPARIPRPLLRIDPFWDSLRNNPRFERLIAGK
jgi:serine/threonine-protein kinase